MERRSRDRERGGSMTERYLPPPGRHGDIFFFSFSGTERQVRREERWRSIRRRPEHIYHGGQVMACRFSP